MKSYKVISNFYDKYTKELHEMGSYYETADTNRADELQKGGFIEKEELKLEGPVSILELNVNEVIAAITPELPLEELSRLLEQESNGKNRTTVIKHIESLSKGDENEPGQS